MDLGLAGQGAVVLGAAKGIGRAIAEGFVAEGASVAVSDIDDRVAQLAEALERRAPGRVVSRTADVTDWAAMEQLAAWARQQLGRCDHLVFAVGAGSGKYGFPFWRLAPQDWPRVLEVNLLGAVNALHAFRPHLCDGGGAVTLITSVAAQIGSPTDPPYSAAKAALINFGHCAAKDLAPYNVRVNLVSPGMVRTDLNRSVWEAWRAQDPERHTQDYESWAAEKIRRLTPLGRWQEPEDVAAAVLFLSSPRAKNITGQTLNVDGGWVMHA